LVVADNPDSGHKLRGDVSFNSADFTQKVMSAYTDQVSIL
jgi:hypothetical protein